MRLAGMVVLLAVAAVGCAGAGKDPPGGAPAGPAAESVSLVVRDRNALSTGLQFEIATAGRVAVYHLPEMRRTELEISEPLRARIMELAGRTFELRDGDYAQTSEPNMIGLAVKFAGSSGVRRFQLLYGRPSGTAQASPKVLVQLISSVKEVRSW